jgi:hypothetical protein
MHNDIISRQFFMLPEGWEAAHDVNDATSILEIISLCSDLTFFLPSDSSVPRKKSYEKYRYG